MTVRLQSQHLLCMELSLTQSGNASQFKQGQLEGLLTLIESQKKKKKCVEVHGVANANELGEKCVELRNEKPLVSPLVVLCVI